MLKRSLYRRGNFSYKHYPAWSLMRNIHIWISAMFDMVGNAWEWTNTLFHYPDPPKNSGLEPPHNKPEYKRRYGQKYYTVKGGSFVDSKDGSVNLEARCASRWAEGPSHKSHKALDKYLTKHHFVTEMCTPVHISVTKCCIGGFVQHNNLMSLG